MFIILVDRCMLGLNVYLYDAADIYVVLAERKLTSYVYAVGKQLISNDWYKMVKDGSSELWMMGWNLLRRLFRFVMRLMFNYVILSIMRYATMF